MSIDIEGIRINTTIEALKPTEGFIVRLNTSMNANTNESRQAERIGREQGVFGSKLNGHVPDFSTAVTEVSSAVTSFATEATNFINDWNSGAIEGSPTYTGSA